MPPFVVSADFGPDGQWVVAWVLSEALEQGLTRIDPATGATGATTDLAMPEQVEGIPPRQPQWVGGDRVVLLTPAGAGVRGVTLAA